MLDRLALFNSFSKNTKSILRLVFGTSFALCTAVFCDVFSPQMAALFTVMLLAKGKNQLSIKQSVAALVVLFALGLFGLFLGSFVQDFVLPTLLILALVIFWSFRLTALPEAIRTLFLVLTLLLPLLSLSAEPAGLFVLSSMLINLAIALVSCQLAFLFFSYHPALKTNEPSKQTPTQIFNIDKIALNGLLVLLPAVLFFYFFRANSYLLTFAYIVILSLDPAIYKSKRSLNMLAANAVGGAVGILCYNLLTVVPTFGFYLFLTLATGLFFSYKIYSVNGKSEFYAMAFRTFFLVMGVVFSSSDTAETSVVNRLFGIALAISYVVLAYRVIAYFNRLKTLENELA